MKKEEERKERIKLCLSYLDQEMSSLISLFELNESKMNLPIPKANAVSICLTS